MPDRSRERHARQPVRRVPEHPEWITRDQRQYLLGRWREHADITRAHDFERCHLVVKLPVARVEKDVVAEPDFRSGRKKESR